MADDVKNAPCMLCTQVTKHHVIARKDRSTEEGSDVYYFLECAGCGAVSMANVWNVTGENEARYYPSPISRKPPDWLWKLRFLFGEDEKPLGELLHEIYEAVQGKQHRLALMGIRAFFEQLMIAKVGDHKSFGANLTAFLNAGFIAKKSADRNRAHTGVRARRDTPRVPANRARSEHGAQHCRIYYRDDLFPRASSKRSRCARAAAAAVGMWTN
jgi:hypothetical protein